MQTQVQLAGPEAKCWMRALRSCWDPCGPSLLLEELDSSFLLLLVAFSPAEVPASG